LHGLAYQTNNDRRVGTGTAMCLILRGPLVLAKGPKIQG
jgi:hypothetical protein